MPTILLLTLEYCMLPKNSSALDGSSEQVHKANASIDHFFLTARF